MGQQLPGEQYSRFANMRDIAAVIVALMVIIALVSCGEVTSSPPPPATPVPFPPAGWKLTLNDPMTRNTNGHWAEGAGSVPNGAAGSCSFARNVYQVQAKKGAWVCRNLATNFANLAVEAQATIVKGPHNAEASLFFRDTTPARETATSSYAFYISSDKVYGLDIYKGGSSVKTLGKGSTAAIHGGLNQPNVMAVVAQGETLKLYVNNQLIDMVSDEESSYGRGGISLGATTYVTDNPTQVNFMDVKVWVPPS